MRVIAVMNQKGGVGKTTSSVNISAGLARQGHDPVAVTRQVGVPSGCTAGFIADRLSVLLEFMRAWCAHVG